MPRNVEPIDVIARQKQRDVLYLSFCTPEVEGVLEKSFDWKNNSVRQQVIAWLEDNDIPYRCCHRFCVSGVLKMPYCGKLYLDVPVDSTNQHFAKLADYFEHADGSVKIDGVRFCYLPLYVAMKNAHQDEPGTWDTMKNRLRSALWP